MEQKDIEHNINVLQGRLIAVSVAVAALVRTQPSLRVDLEKAANHLADVSLAIPMTDQTIEAFRTMLLQIAGVAEHPMWGPMGGSTA